MFAFDEFPPTREADFRNDFASKTWAKAKQLAAAGDVELLECSQSTISAEVQGSEYEPYEVMIEADGNYDCTCPSEVQPCKHVAATLLVALKEHGKSGAKKGQTNFDLKGYLQKLDLAQARALLLDLAGLNEVRQHLLRRVLVKGDGIPKGAIKALKKMLDSGKNIENEGELGEAAFAQLAALEPEERSDEAYQIYELLDSYEPYGGDDYDPYDESGDAYWEDRQSDWMALALKHWGTAEAELGRGEAALQSILKEVGSSQEMWEAALETALRLANGKTVIEGWLKGQRGGENRALERFRRDFLQRFRRPEEYEEYLRDNLDTPSDYRELVQHLQSHNRLSEALEVAAEGVRGQIGEYRKFKGDFEGTWGGMYIHGHPGVEHMLEMLSLLRQQRPEFEWEEAVFVLHPSLEHYRKLKTFPQFAQARAALLKVPLQTNLHFDLLLDDGDEAALEGLLTKHPRPQHALKVKHLFPVACAQIFKKATIEEIGRGSREYYREAAEWAAHYYDLEDKEKFKTWLRDLLEINKRRPALQQEFKHLATKLR